MHESKLPWTTNEGTIWDADGKFVATTWEDRDAAFGPSRDIANAHTIVDAVNKSAAQAERIAVLEAGLEALFGEGWSVWIDCAHRVKAEVARRAIDGELP